MEGTLQFIGITTVLLLSLISLGVKGEPGHVNIQIKVLQYNNTDGMSYNRSNFKGPRKCCDRARKLNCSTIRDTCDTYFLYGIGRIGRNGFSGSQTNTIEHMLSDTNVFSDPQERSLVADIFINNWEQNTTMVINVWDKDIDGKDLIDNMTSIVGRLATGWNQDAAPKHILSLQNYVSLALEIQIWCKDGYYGTSCDRVCRSDRFHICNHDGMTSVSPSCTKKNVLVLRGQVKDGNRTALQNDLENLILHVICFQYTLRVTVQILEINRKSYVAFTAQCNGTNVVVLKFQMMYIVDMLVTKLSTNFRALVPSMMIGQTIYQDKTRSQYFGKGRNFLMLLRVNGLTRKPDPGCTSSSCTYHMSLCVLRDCSRSNKWLDLNVTHGNGSIINCRDHLIDPTIFNAGTGSAATFFLKLDIMPAFIRVKVKDSANALKVWNFTKKINSSYSPGLQYNMADTQTVTLLNSDGLSVMLELAIWCAIHSNTSAVKECRSDSHICLPGFTGAQCKTDIDECQAANPCQHGGACINTVGMFKCNCTHGWTGPTCTKDANECLLGLNGFNGTNCQDIDECLSYPCRNGATCLNTLGAYACRCRNGFTGATCETDINECKEKICSENSLNCTNNFGSFSCKCKSGWVGEYCRKDINECAHMPCKHNGSCTNLPGTYKCYCSPGWNGKHCEQDINECNTDRPLCTNGGTCINTNGDFKCSCNKSWTGKTCSVDVDECHLQPCYNDGTCNNFDGGFNCTCTNGWRGVKCHEDIDECLNRPCKNNGSCSNIHGGYNCTCKHGLVGKNCENECFKSPCSHAATCQNTIGSYSCSCLSGWSGQLCILDIDECKHDPCLNGGQCENTPGSYSCKCLLGWQGENCSRDVDECTSSPCHNKGTCENFDGSFNCSCPKGWTGSICQTDINECEENICQNNATCINSGGRFSCGCASGWNGTVCDSDINECTQNPCKNHGTCQNTNGSFVCECFDGWKGSYCETDIDECLFFPCLNDGTCTNFDGNYQCTCTLRWRGRNCSMDFDECATNPCYHESNCTNTIGGYTCNCLHEWSGENCSVDVNECLSSPCVNNGTCINELGGYICSCSSAWTGSKCELDQDECLSKPCQHGICENRNGSFNCKCPVQWKGIDCSKDVDECELDPCQYEGTCLNSDGSYTCICSSGWTGANCSNDLNECSSNPCKNRGICSNLEGSYACTCLSGWTGINCLTQVSSTSSRRTITTVLSSTIQTSTRRLYDLKSTKKSQNTSHIATEYTKKGIVGIHNSTYIGILNKTKKQPRITGSDTVTQIVINNISTTPGEAVTSELSSEPMNISIVQALVTKIIYAQTDYGLSKDTEHLSKATGASNATDRRTPLHTIETKSSSITTRTIPHSTPANLLTQNVETDIFKTGQNPITRKNQISVDSTQKISTIPTIIAFPHPTTEVTTTTEQTQNIMTFASRNEQTEKYYTPSKTRTETDPIKQTTNLFVQNLPEISSVILSKITTGQQYRDKTTGTNQGIQTTLINANENQEGANTMVVSMITPTVLNKARTTDSTSRIHNEKRTAHTIPQSSTYLFYLHGISQASYATKDSKKGQIMATISSVTYPSSPSTMKTATDTAKKSDESKLGTSNSLPLIAGAGGGGALVLIVVIIAVIRCRRNRRLNDGLNSSTATKGKADTQDSILMVNPMYDAYESDKTTDHFC